MVTDIDATVKEVGRKLLKDTGCMRNPGLEPVNGLFLDRTHRSRAIFWFRVRFRGCKAYAE